MSKENGVALLSGGEGEYILTEIKTLAARQGLFKMFFRVPRYEVWWLKQIWKSQTTGETLVILRSKGDKGYVSDATTETLKLFPNLFLSHKDEIGLLTTGKRADSAIKMSICVKVFDSRYFLESQEHYDQLNKVT